MSKGLWFGWFVGLCLASLVAITVPGVGLIGGFIIGLGFTLAGSAIGAFVARDAR